MSGAGSLRASWAGWPRGAVALLVAANALLLFFAAMPPVLAADIGAAVYSAPAYDLAVGRQAKRPPERMLLESDQLLYDYDNDTVSAVGNVTIYYAGYTLQADKVTYNKRSGRLAASGRVKLTDPSGATAYSDFIDITDDFRDGFVQSLRVETPQDAYFTAQSAERRAGETTTFVNGSYTACKPCADHPEKPPLWNIKATKIVIDHKEHMVYFTDARIEFFGLPVAWLPYFAMADPSVRRKSGLLTPRFGYSAKLGAQATLPYFWAMAPNYDLTFTPTVLSRQGFLGEVAWRHRLQHGQYTIDAVGIRQLDKNAFNSNSPSYRDWRGAIRTTGQFYLNRDWTLGWDGTLSSDRTFTRDYSVLNSDTSETTSTIHLTGLKDRNFFEARASYFQILTDQSSSTLSYPEQYDQGRQAIVAPVVDYHRVAGKSYFGGELSFNDNLTVLTRSEDDPFEPFSTMPPYPYKYFLGTAGTYARLTKEIDWRRQIIGPFGQVFTPFASVRGDAFFLNGQTSDAINAGLTDDSTAFRFMPAAGIEWSWPILITSAGATQIIEPKAQLIVRPDQTGFGTLPNNDSQSLVFDASDLFKINKYSGYDDIESGTRLNIGLVYNATLASGATVDGTFGQSIQLAGQNPYSMPDLAGVGPYSGLATDSSDYVADLSIDSGVGPRFTASSRFDQSTFAVNRWELEATTALGPVTASTAYLYLRQNPYSGTGDPTSVVRSAASVNLAPSWRAFGSLTYDIANSALAADSFGVAFDSDCLTFSLAYSETRKNYTDIAPDRWVGLRLELRTLGEAGVNANLSKLTD